MFFFFWAGGENRANYREAVSEEIISESFSKFKKDMRPWIESMSQGPNRMNTNKFRSGYAVVKVQKTKGRHIKSQWSNIFIILNCRPRILYLTSHLKLRVKFRHFKICEV